MERALFAGGCFWCMVEPFEEMPGIISITSGYTGGHVEHPSYEEVKAGGTGHTEAVEIFFDPDIISYSDLLDIYWRQTDPTDATGQFTDRGDSYRPVIFYSNAEQKRIAETSKADLQASGRFSDPIVTQIQPANHFYPAEDYHQDFHKKSRDRYLADESTQARHDFIQKNWQD